MAEPREKMLKLAKNLASIPEAITRNAVIPFLNEKSLYALTWTCRHNRNQYKDKHADKKVAAEMLHCVLNPTLPNQARFLELLSMPRRDNNGQALYLIQNHGEEVYFNKARVRKTKTMRYSTNVLEAILRTKNFHLAKTLFNCIPAQEKTDTLKQYISVIKSQEMWGVSELQAAYKNFLEPWQALYDSEKWDELNRLSGRIGKALKEHLPWFSIYLFCHPVTHAKADYSQAPHWTCILYDEAELDLDSFGGDSFYALYKGYRGEFACVLLGGTWRAGPPSAVDSASFSRQCEVLSSEMDKTIKSYDLDEPKPDSASRPSFD